MQGIKPDSATKPSKVNKIRLQSLYLQSADHVEQGQMYLEKVIIALCNHDKEKLEEFSQKTIEIEKSLDRIHENIITKMFSKETLAFSRADRLLLNDKIDDVVDTAEMLVRRVMIYLPDEVPREMIPHFKEIAFKTQKIGTLLKHAIISVFDDFDKAYESARQVEIVRREAKQDYMHLLEELYHTKPDYRDFLYFDRLCRNIVRNIDSCETLSDEIRTLVFKYRL